MMGARSIGVAGAGLGAAIVAATGGIGGLLGRVFGRTGGRRPEDQRNEGNDNTDVNRNKHRRVDNQGGQE